MTEQETRNKINKIIFDVLHRKCVGDDCDKCVYKMNYGKKYCAIDRICDALIAAGIEDVSEWKDKATAAELVAQAAANTAIERIEEWKHRAEVAEKIAEEACRIVFCEAIDNEEWDKVIRKYKETKEKYSDELGITDEMLYDYLHEKAEKELQEGR